MSTKKLYNLTLSIILIGAFCCCRGGCTSKQSCCESVSKEECCLLNPKDECCQIEIERPKIDQINFYLENSHSMGGYFQSKTDFYANIDKIITDLVLKDKYPGKVNTYTIADSIGRFKDVSNFRNQLDPTNETKIAIAKSSPLHEIMGMICRASNDNDVNLFVTDGIISGSNEDLMGYDDGKKGLYYNISFADKLQNNLKGIINTDCDNFSIKVLAYQSNFNSTSKHPYYKLDNNVYSGSKIGEFTQRPYYIFILGKTQLVNDFYANCQSTFAPKEELEIGFKYTTKTKPTGYYLHGGNDCTVSGNQVVFSKNAETYKMGLLMDLQELPQMKKTADFLGQQLKIFVNGSQLENTRMKVHDAKAMKALLYANSKTVEETRGYTHLAEVEINDYQPNLEDKIEIKLINQTPKWYQDWSAKDDLKIELDNDKTFGLNYLIEGILEAYYEDSENYLLEYQLNHSIK